jgi:hypothetical protein
MRNNLDKETLKKIQEDLKLYFDFLELYNKPRKIENQSKIDEFVKKESSIMRRIRYIDELDAKEKGKTKEEKFKEEQIIVVPPAKSKKKKLRKNSLLNFIFGERKPVKSFGIRTQTLTLKIFGIVRKNTPEASAEWARYRADMNDLLFKPFAYIISNGWRYLDRLHYNVCASFAIFINYFVKNSKPLRQGRTDEQMVIFDDCLPNYLQVVSSEEYRNILIESVDDTMPRITFENSDFVKPFLEEIIDVNVLKPLSFFNIILAEYMIHYKKNFTLNTLCSFFKLPPINDNKYNFHKKVKEVVVDEVKKARRRYNKVNKELFKIRSIEENLSLDSDKHNPMVRFINRISVADRNIQTMDKVENPMTSNPFRFMRNDLIGFMYRFLSGFVITYGDFLNDRVYIKSGNERKKVQIFEESFFSDELNLIKSTIKDYEIMKQASEYTTITLSTFINYKEKVKPMSEKEDKLCLYTKRAIDALYSIRDKLNEVMYNNFLATSLTGKMLLNAQKENDIPIGEIESRPRFLTHGKDMVIINRYHDSKTVEKVIDEVVMATSNIAYLFGKNDVLQTISEEEDLIRRCEGELQIISKLA